jgi:hypothetical protein
MGGVVSGLSAKDLRSCNTKVNFSLTSRAFPRRVGKICLHFADFRAPSREKERLPRYSACIWANCSNRPIPIVTGISCQARRPWVASSMDKLRVLPDALQLPPGADCQQCGQPSPVRRGACKPPGGACAPPIVRKSITPGFRLGARPLKCRRHEARG